MSYLPVPSDDIWGEVMAALPDGAQFSSLHQNLDRPGVWVASVVLPPPPKCECCGSITGVMRFVTGQGDSPEAACQSLLDELATEARAR